jgi:hypothetical protein
MTTSPKRDGNSQRLVRGDISTDNRSPIIVFGGSAAIYVSNPAIGYLTSHYLST